MTHRATLSPRICPSCDGFASAAITLGGRDPHGHLRTITAHCPACQGTGTTHRRTRRSLEGARA
jgi:DnaJ-class molecular chaperone